MRSSCRVGDATFWKWVEDLRLLRSLSKRGVDGNDGTRNLGKKGGGGRGQKLGLGLLESESGLGGEVSGKA